MKCPYCNEFKSNNKVRGYTIKEQLQRHIDIKHCKCCSSCGCSDFKPTDFKGYLKCSNCGQYLRVSP